MQAARSAAVQLARQAPGQQVRHMSGHGTPAENARWMQFWTYTTYAAIPVLLGVGAYQASQHHDHHGANLLPGGSTEAPDYPYLKKRDRKFPWGSNCDLFDFHCEGA